MKKKLIVILLGVLLLIAFIFANLSQKDRRPFEIKQIKNSLRKKESLIRNKVEVKAQKKTDTKEETIDINLMTPCDAANYFAKNPSESYQYLKRTPLNLLFELKKNPIKLANKMVTQDDLLQESEGNLLVLYELQKNPKNYISEQEPLFKEIVQGLRDELYHLAYTLESRNQDLEAVLIRAQLEYDKHPDLADLSFGSINEKTPYISHFNDLALKALRSATTPSEIAAALMTISVQPSFDFSFLLKNKKKIAENKRTLISEKIINKQLKLKRYNLRDAFSYSIARHLHPNKKLMNLTPTNNDLFTRWSHYYGDIYGSIDPDFCDDREFIKLCDKYCSK